MRKSRIIASALVLLLSSCSGDKHDEPSKSNQPAASLPQKTPPVLEPVVVTDQSGMTVYYHDHDPPLKSYCNGNCEQYWPPVRPSTDLELSGNFTVIKRKDGSPQVAYENRPLYTFRGDQKPGDTKGDGADGVWHALRFR
jgi:predicted lipoprotein with Yx(FWY)xxD motif